jgi:hypothetical protein
MPDTYLADTYLLPAEVRDAILTYLGNKPYREVASGMKALLDLPTLTPKPEADGATGD